MLRRSDCAWHKRNQERVSNKIILWMSCKLHVLQIEKLWRVPMKRPDQKLCQVVWTILNMLEQWIGSVVRCHELSSWITAETSSLRLIYKWRMFFLNCASHWTAYNCMDHHVLMTATYGYCMRMLQHRSAQRSWKSTPTNLILFKITQWSQRMSKTQILESAWRYQWSLC